ncbi:helix-hairpin-helix domain-containing protein [Salibacterium aidingense]|uniref:helix-hairpin-helix domain-containing protein n=1 Tax=Salibacterium aidingense TaxID=384933 RepID=UPI00041582C8|nr:helix-hairpin-helix domain-containing protein [Salibacterium aidingense]
MQRNTMIFWIAGSAAVILLVWLGIIYFFQAEKNMEPAGGQEAFIQDLEVEGTERKEEKGEDAKDTTEGKDEKLLVDVKGAVQNPGVYELEEGERIIDALDAAGGILEKGEPLGVNFAEKLEDEMVVYVPEEGEETTIAVKDEKEDDLVRINYAEASSLETLPGIGPAKAGAIISYREENGLFEQVDELLQVSGIGEASLEQMKERITLE